MSTPTSLRRALSTGAVAAALAFALAPGADAQAAATVTVSPNTGAPGSTFTITMNNYTACDPNDPNSAGKCIIIDFIQGTTTTTIGHADSRGATTFTGQLTVPPTAKAGAATIRAHSDKNDASTAYTVTTGATTSSSSSTTRPTTTTSSSTTTSSTSTSTTETTEILATTTPTTAPKAKKKSTHSDTPRYIAVALVVLAAAATAAVDTRLRRLRPPV